MVVPYSQLDVTIVIQIVLSVIDYKCSQLSITEGATYMLNVNGEVPMVTICN